MTSRQKYIIAALAAINSIIILAVVMLVTRPHTVLPSSKLVSTASNVRDRQACQRHATQILAQANLSGVVSLTSDKLRFEIVYPLTNGKTGDDAAQQTWKAFDIASALIENQCDTFSQIEVVILAQSDEGETCITAQVNADDLKAFYANELDERAFIERVSYDTP